jgi:hypothetical protein
MGDAQHNIPQPMQQAFTELTVDLTELPNNIQTSALRFLIAVSLCTFICGSWQFIPSTVVVKKCAGACLHQLSCVPTEKKMAPFSVSTTGLFMAVYGVSGVETIRVIPLNCIWEMSG